MDTPNLLLAVIWLLVAPFAADSGAAQPASRPVGIIDVAPAVPVPGQGYFGELRLRVALPDVSLEAPRKLARDMVCALGLVALALLDCSEADADAGQGISVLAPEADARRGAGGPYLPDVGRRSIEQRMHSI